MESAEVSSVRTVLDGTRSRFSGQGLNKLTFNRLQLINPLSGLSYFSSPDS